MTGRLAAAASRALALLRGRSGSCSSGRSTLSSTTISQCLTSSIVAPSNAAPLPSIFRLRSYSNDSSSSETTSRTFLSQRIQHRRTETFSNRSVFDPPPSLLSRARRALATTPTSGPPPRSSATSPSVEDKDYDADADSDSLTDDDRRGRSRKATKKKEAATAKGEEREEGESSSSFSSSSSWPGSDVEDEDDASGSFGSDEEAESPASDLRDRLFDVAVSEGHVARHGWTNDALSSAARSLGLSPSAARLARRGPADLALWFVRKCNEEFRESLGEGFSADVDGAKREGFSADVDGAKRKGKSDERATTNARVDELASLPGTTARIEAAIWWRLQPLLPHSGSWHQAAASVALAGPSAAAEAARELWTWCDDAWTLAAGDREPAASSVASSYYTKRATLAAVYAACELHLLADYSPGHEETRRSIRRRLDDAAAVARASKSLLPTSPSNPLASLASEAAARAREAVACGPLDARRRRREGAAYYPE